MFTVSPDILILGFIAGFVLFKLFSILGRKDNDGEVTSFNKDGTLSHMIDVSSSGTTEDITDLSLIEKDLAPGFAEVIAEIRKKDAQFSLQKFLDGAKVAFEMVLTAFAKDDRETLNNLLGNDTYKQFVSEIEARLQNKVTLDLTLVALPIVKIENIQFSKGKISIDVMYGSQQINILKNENGEVVEGSPSQIDHMEDIWSFEKVIDSKESWKLVKVNAS